jgi:hypothetical protein
MTPSLSVCTVLWGGGCAHNTHSIFLEMHCCEIVLGVGPGLAWICDPPHLSHALLWGDSHEPGAQVLLLFLSVHFLWYILPGFLSLKFIKAKDV